MDYKDSAKKYKYDEVVKTKEHRAAVGRDEELQEQLKKD